MSVPATAAGALDESLASSADDSGRVPLHHSILGRVLIVAAVAVVLGVVSALVWRALVNLPTYTVTDHGTAVISDSGLTRFIAADAWFALIGLPLGVGLGYLVWTWCRTMGWPIALVAVGAGLLAARMCLTTAALIGPANFAERLASANPGERVSVDLALTTSTALLVWPLATLIPILLYASLGPESDSEAQLPLLPRAGREGLPPAAAALPRTP